ncbi:MAG: 50S ribosomal protein L4 [Chloroflexi bacterium]|nr:50S ribosomal protein L4 [Chloroflexota bacterium]
MELPVYSLSGEVIKRIEVSDLVFGVPFNGAVVHQTMVRQQANARQGTASTKTRGEVAGSTRKLYAQKHTGRARAGSIKSPLRRGGGIIFGPKPRSYRQAMPKKMRRLALRCTLSAKARDGDLVIIEGLEMNEPDTGEMKKILTTLGANSSALVVTAGPQENVIKSARNLPRIKTLPASILNVGDLLSHKRLVMTEPAVRKAEELWGKTSSQRRSDAPDPGIAPTTDN